MVFACKKCKKVFRKDMTYIIFYIYSNNYLLEFLKKQMNIVLIVVIILYYFFFYKKLKDNHFVIEAKTPEIKEKFIIQLEDELINKKK